MQKTALPWLKKIKDLPQTQRVDKIVAISRGGLVAARIFSDLLNIPVSQITISSYENLKQEKEPVIEEVPSRSFQKETILLVDEISETGKTFDRAIGYFKHLPVKKIYTLAPYVKSKTPRMPDFWLEKIDAWIIFPYEIRETYASFLKIFNDKEKTRRKMLNVGFEEWEVDGII